MPKATFDRIKLEKKERLLREAAGLFAERGFTQADMGELAARAGIAKGSIYNYFESKDELYQFVCRDGLDRSRRVIWEPLSPRWGVRCQVEHIFRVGANFALSHPEYVALYLNVAAAGSERFNAALSSEVEQPTAERLKAILEEAVAAGKLAADLDVEATAFCLNGLYIMMVASLVAPHFRQRLGEYFVETQPCLVASAALEADEVERFVERIVAVAGRALGLRPGAGEG